MMMADVVCVRACVRVCATNHPVTLPSQSQEVMSVCGDVVL